MGMTVQNPRFLSGRKPVAAKKPFSTYLSPTEFLAPPPPPYHSISKLVYDIVKLLEYTYDIVFMSINMVTKYC